MAEKSLMFKELWEFVRHVLVESTIFLIIALIAIGLHLIIRWFEGMKISKIILYGLIGTEYFLFGISILLFIIFLATTAWRRASFFLRSREKHQNDFTKTPT